MGGRGSGRSGRPSYESTRSLILCTTTFARAGLRFGVSGYSTLTFTSDDEPPFAATIETDTTVRQAPYMRFAHARRTDPPIAEQYNVRLLTSPQPFGGVRWWFECPRTGRRAVKLYLPLGGHQFWSRHAYGLGYASQREDRMGRAQQQAIKIYRALGGDGHWMDGAPPKPKWMRWRTYDRLATKLDTYNARFDSACVYGARRLLARYG
jgi:hypothetical protein